MHTSQSENHVNLGELGALVEALNRQLESGVEIDLEAFVRKHPCHAERIRQLLPTIQSMIELGQTPPQFCAQTMTVQTTTVASACSENRGRQRLGDFELLEELGRGGMGIVYRARQVSRGRDVALKTLHLAALADKGQLVRFRNEAHVAATLHHPHIVPAYLVGCERGVHFYVMELVDGPNLASVVEAMRDAEAQPSCERLPVESIPDQVACGVSRASDATQVHCGTTTSAVISLRTASRRKYFRTVAKWACQVAGALSYAHRHGVVHRDVKPSNLLLADTGQVVITDFGLARLAGSEQVAPTGDRAGTLRYMSPEYAAGLYWDHRTDIYSLGVTLYELLTLIPPFGHSERRDLLRSIIDDEPPLLRRLEPAIPLNLQTLVRRAIERRPEDRYATAQMLAEDLERFLGDRPIQAQPPTRRE